MLIEVTDHITGDRQALHVDPRVSLRELAKVAADRFGYHAARRCRLGIPNEAGGVMAVHDSWTVGQANEARLALVAT